MGRGVSRRRSCGGARPGAGGAPVIAGEVGQQPRPARPPPRGELGFGGTAMDLPENGRLSDVHRFGARKTLPSVVPGARPRPGRLLWAHSDYQVPESANEDTLEEPRSLALRGHGCLGRDCIDTLAGCAALGGAGTLLRWCWSSARTCSAPFSRRKGGKGSLLLRARLSGMAEPQCPTGCHRMWLCELRHPSGSRMENSRCRDPVTAVGWAPGEGRPHLLGTQAGGLLDVGSFGLSG